MDATRFDAFVRTLAAGLPRRRLLGRLAGGGLAAAIGLRAARRPAAARTGVETASTSSAVCVGCDQLRCQCRFLPDGTLTCNVDCKVIKVDFGIAGGGTVGLPEGEATLAMVATAVLDEAAEPSGRGSGLLRWVDPTWEGRGLVLESLGVGRYGPVGGMEGVRELDGLVLANGEGPYPFVLRVTDAGPGGRDEVALAVGDQAVEGGGETGFSYGAAGPLLAGDLVGTWTLPEVPQAATPEA